VATRPFDPSIDGLRHTTCRNCGSTKHKLVLVWNGGTFWRCADMSQCIKRCGPCLACGQQPDRHEYEPIPGGKGALRPITHDFVRSAAAQAAIDKAYKEVK
jgi:hypothetical protein